MVNWTAPGALWLLALVPAIWFAPLVARTTFNPRQRVLQAAARSLLLTVLALAIARPVLSTSSPRQSIVYLVDISHSVASRAIEDAARRIDEYNATLRPSYWHSKVPTALRPIRRRFAGWRRSTPRRRGKSWIVRGRISRRRWALPGGNWRPIRRPGSSSSATVIQPRAASRTRLPG